MPHGMTSIDEVTLAELRKAAAERDELKEANAALRIALAICAPRPSPEVESLLGPFETLLYDKGCREPIGWGFKITRKLEDDEAELMKKFGDIEFLHTQDAEGNNEYGLIVRWLTELEAITKYGKRGETRWGPRGGFLGVFYGDKEFNHRKMKPAGVTKP